MRVFKLIFATLAMLAAGCGPNPIPEIYFVARHEGASHPTEMVIAEGKVWLAQLYEDTLYSAEGIPYADTLQRLEPDSGIASPHFMAASKRGIYVSEGRGDTVRYFSFDGTKNGERLNLSETLQRPHGLCIHNDWLYIADSVGSRLLRTNLRDKRTQIFADHDKKIAYGRQLLCRDDGIWLSNSYEKAFPLNDGVGSNILRITDFASGIAETVIAFPQTNTTGLAILDDRLLLIGRWTNKRDIVALDLVTGQLIGILFTSNIELDTPYGMFVDEATRRLYVAFLGINPDRAEGSRGAILEWKY